MIRVPDLNKFRQFAIGIKSKATAQKIADQTRVNGFQVRMFSNNESEWEVWIGPKRKHNFKMKKNRIDWTKPKKTCQQCRKPCWGKICKECFKKNKAGKLSIMYGKRKHQKEDTKCQKEEN